MGTAFGSKFPGLGQLASMGRYPAYQAPDQAQVMQPSIPRPQVGWSANVNPAGPIAWNNRNDVEVLPPQSAQRPQWSPRGYGQQDNLDPDARMGYRMPVRDPRSMARPDYNSQGNMNFQDPMNPPMNPGQNVMDGQRIAAALKKRRGGGGKKAKGGKVGWRPYTG